MAKYYLTAGRLINDVVVDTGLDPSSDPVADTGKVFVQLQRQLDIAIEELAETFVWEEFKRTHSFVSSAAASYDLPDDFHYMVDQTHWDLTSDLPVTGPLSSQQWAYLKGTDNLTIYASFRVANGVLVLHPESSTGATINFEYASRNWIRNAADSAYLSTVGDSADTILYPPPLIRAYLKAKFLESKGFATVTARDAVAYFMDSVAGKDGGAPVLRMGGGRSLAYLGARNIPDRGYGA